MKHRSIETGGVPLSVAAAEHVLEYGGDADLVVLMKELRERPFSETAEHALLAAGRSSVYGIRHAIPGCIALWRQGQASRQAATYIQPEILRTDADGRPSEALELIPLEIGRFVAVLTTLGRAGLVRTRAPETTPREGFAAPSPAEKMRLCAARILASNAEKDFRKIASLTFALGLGRSIRALAEFDARYVTVDRTGRVRPFSPAIQLVRQLSEPRPFEPAARAGGDASGGGSEDFAVCRELGVMLADYLFSPSCSLERRLREIEGGRAAGHPPPSVPPYPAETHTVQVSDDGGAVVVRKKKSVSAQAEIDNPLGPAIVTHGGERYALQGRFLSKAAWEGEVSPRGPAERHLLSA